jgi:microcystin-dependent protein
MSTPYLTEIRMVGYNFAMKGWAFCNGQTLQIAQNQALFSLLGTTYGGNGQTTFALPNLQGSTPMHQGTSPVGNNINYTIGQTGGEQSHTITGQEMPQHTHNMVVQPSPANNIDPAGAYLAASSGTNLTNAYAAPSAINTTMNPQAILPFGGSQPHENMQPYLVVNFIICLQGLFPSRN